MVARIFIDRSDDSRSTGLRGEWPAALLGRRLRPSHNNA
jgi:hypothetical protein